MFDNTTSPGQFYDAIRDGGRILSPHVAATSPGRGRQCPGDRRAAEAPLLGDRKYEQVDGIGRTAIETTHEGFGSWRWGT